MRCCYLVLSDTRRDSFSSWGWCSLTLCALCNSTSLVEDFASGMLPLNCLLGLEMLSLLLYVLKYNLLFSVLLLTFSSPNGGESYQSVYSHSFLRFPYFLFIYFKKVCVHMCRKCWECAWQVTRATTWSAPGYWQVPGRWDLRTSLTWSLPGGLWDLCIAIRLLQRK